MQIFTTQSDAAAHLNGTNDWDWGDHASQAGFVQFAYRNQELFETRDEDDNRAFDADAAIRAYLRSVGENPADYSL